jgi:hypothetical protein
MIPSEKLKIIQAAMQCLCNAEVAIESGMDAAIYNCNINMAFLQLKALDRDANKDLLVHDIGDTTPPDADSGFSLIIR